MDWENRYLVMVDPSRNIDKHWQITRKDKRVLRQWGRRDGGSQHSIKEFETVFQASREMVDAVEEKRQKGYREDQGSILLLPEFDKNGAPVDTRQGYFLAWQTVDNITISLVTSHEHSGTGILFNNSRGCEVTNSSILNSEIGVLCENASAPEIHWSTITGNTVYGVRNTDPTVAVNAENNYWGDKSGPSGAGPGTGDKISQYVDFDPWVGGALPSNRKEHKVSPGKGTVDAKADADTEVEYDTDNPLTISTMKYNSNPGKGFEGDVGKYIDVHLNSSGGVREIVVKLYYTASDLNGKDESGLKMFWYDGNEWKQCSDTGVSTDDTGDYAGYIWAKVRSDTTPSLTNLSGTPFGAGETEETGGEVEDDDGGSAVLLVGGVIVLVVVLLLVLVKTGIVPIGGVGKEKDREMEKDGKGMKESRGMEKDSSMEKEGKRIKKGKDSSIQETKPDTGKQEVKDTRDMKKDNDTGNRKDNRKKPGITGHNENTTEGITKED